jgi:hypothetical protein
MTVLTSRKITHWETKQGNKEMTNKTDKLFEFRTITQKELGEILQQVREDYSPDTPASEIIPVIGQRVINLLES